MASFVKGKGANDPPYKYVWELVQKNRISDIKPLDATAREAGPDKLGSNTVVNPIDIQSQEKLTCATAPGIVFSSIEHLRQHLRSDYHVFNLKRKMKRKKLLSLEAFSKSDASSDEEEEIDEVRERKKVIDFDCVSTELLPLSYFRFRDGEFKASVWSCILDKESGTISFNPHTNTVTWLLLLYSSSGHFAGAVYQNGRCIAHKTFHRYTSRRKQGGSQSAHDNKSGKANSIGAQIRRANEVQLRKDIHELLVNKWHRHVQEANSIFIGATSRNRAVFFKIPTGVKIKCAALQKSDKIKYIPFATARPTLSECDSVCRRLGRLRFMHNVSISESNTKLQDVNEPVTQIAESVAQGTSIDLVGMQPVVAIPSLSEGRVCLHDAIVRNDTQLVKKILKKSERYVDNHSAPNNYKREDTVNVNDALDAKFSTGLHVAVKQDLHDMVKLLLLHNANPALLDSKQNPPFKLAKSKKVRDVFRLYMGSNPDKWDYKTAAMESAGALTLEKINERKRKAKEKKKKARQRKKEQLKVSKKGALMEQMESGLDDYNNNVNVRAEKTSLSPGLASFQDTANTLRKTNSSSQNVMEDEVEIMERIQDIAIRNGEISDIVLVSMLQVKESYGCSAFESLEIVENALMTGINLNAL
jgi:hypothetical protein